MSNSPMGRRAANRDSHPRLRGARLGKKQARRFKRYQMCGPDEVERIGTPQPGTPPSTPPISNPHGESAARPWISSSPSEGSRCCPGASEERGSHCCQLSVDRHRGAGLAMTTRTHRPARTLCGAPAVGSGHPTSLRAHGWYTHVASHSPTTRLACRVGFVLCLPSHSDRVPDWSVTCACTPPSFAGRVGGSNSPMGRRAPNRSADTQARSATLRALGGRRLAPATAGGTSRSKARSMMLVAPSADTHFCGPGMGDLRPRGGLAPPTAGCGANRRLLLVGCGGP